MTADGGESPSKSGLGGSPQAKPVDGALKPVDGALMPPSPDKKREGEGARATNGFPRNPKVLPS